MKNLLFIMLFLPKKTALLIYVLTFVMIGLSGFANAFIGLVVGLGGAGMIFVTVLAPFYHWVTNNNKPL